MQSAIANLLVSNTDAGNRPAVSELQQARQDFLRSLDDAKAADRSGDARIGDLKSHGLAIVDQNCALAIKLGAAATAPGAILASQDEYLKNCEPAFTPVLAEMSTLVTAADAAKKSLNDALGDETATTILTTHAVVSAGLVLVGLVAWLALRAWISAQIWTKRSSLKLTPMGRSPDGVL